MRTYRVGVVGLYRGLGPARIFDLMPDCNVVAGCDIDARALERFGALFPQARLCSAYDEMLAHGLDIVFVASPVPLHCQHTLAALKAGCHVLQEVTLAGSLDECRQLLAAVQAHPRQKFMLGENCCYWAHMLSWRQMWRRGLLGDFMYAEAEYIHDTRYLLRQPDGSPAWRASMPAIHYCTHSLGPLLKVTGQRCVTASGMSVSGGDGGLAARVESGMEVAILQTASGTVIKTLCAFDITPEPMFHDDSLYGTEGVLETSRPPVSPLQTNAWLASVPHLRNMIEMPITENVTDAPAEATQGGHGAAEYSMIQDFLTCIRHDTRPPLDIYAALRMALPGLCAHESALQGGQMVEIPEAKC
jgi:predicted dehydrogenase